jgi:plastocyanin
MRRLPSVLLTVVATAALAACSSAGAPGWTYAPASPSAVASGAASGAPSAAVSAAPSGAASAAASASAGGSPAPSAAAGAVTIKAAVGASTTGFDPTTAQAAAGTAFTLTFDNQDNQAPHNLVLQNPDNSPVAVQGDTAPFTGPGSRSYEVPALTAGDYKYVCQVHPTTMTGTLTVQ